MSTWSQQSSEYLRAACASKTMRCKESSKRCLTQCLRWCRVAKYLGSACTEGTATAGQLAFICAAAVQSWSVCAQRLHRLPDAAALQGILQSGLQRPRMGSAAVRQNSCPPPFAARLRIAHARQCIRASQSILLRPALPCQACATCTGGMQEPCRMLQPPACLHSLSLVCFRTITRA